MIHMKLHIFFEKKGKEVKMSSTAAVIGMG